MKFGLISGSFAKNKSGGVLRKKHELVHERSHRLYGTFSTTTVGIVRTLERLRIPINTFKVQLYGGTAGKLLNTTIADGLQKMNDGELYQLGESRR